MPSLEQRPYHTTQVLNAEQALAGVNLPGDTAAYLEPFIRREKSRVGDEIKPYELSPDRGASGIIVAKRVLSYFKEKGWRNTGLLETLSTLDANRELIVPGLEIPILGIWAAHKPRCVLLTCTETGVVTVEAYPTSKPLKHQTWEAHDHLRFMAATTPLPN